MERRDAWVYADMTHSELVQRRDALQSLVDGTTGAKQRRYTAELCYVEALIHADVVQLTIEGIFDSLG